VRGLLIAGLTSIAAILVLAAVLLHWQPDTGKMQTAVLAVYGFSCFAGGCYCGKKMKKRKFLWGLLLGLCYFLLLFLLSQCREDADSPELVHSLLILMLSMGGGMLGGMVS
jgi:putative membrane protein (TIGR04086 family)